MKRVRVYKEIISDENLRLAIQEVNAGHRRNGNHSLNKKVIEIENNMDEYVEKLRAFIQGLVDGDEHMHPPSSDGAGIATRTAVKANGETSKTRFCGRTNMFTTLLCSQ